MHGLTGQTGWLAVCRLPAITIALAWLCTCIQTGDAVRRLRSFLANGANALFGC